jgi:hypothetical protein
LFYDTLQVELHKKYDITLRLVVSKNDNHSPSKKLSVNQSKEKEREKITIA